MKRRRMVRGLHLMALATSILAVLVVANGATARSVDTKGTLRGSVAAALRPSAGAVTTVRAIDAQNGTTSARGRVGASGAYRLSAPPGVYLVVVEKVSRRARPVTGFGRLVRVRGGQTSVLRTVNPGSAGARRTTAAVLSTRAPALGSRSGAAVAAGGPPAVAVRYFTGSGPFAILGKGLADMIVTDLVGSRCYVVVEWERRDLLLAEIRLQQSRWVDPSTRVTPRWIQPTIFVEGSVSTTESSVSWNIRMREIASGRIIGSDRGTAGAGASFFDAELALAKRLRKQLEQELCGRFTGQFSGRTREVAAGVQTLDYSFTGTVTFARNDAVDRWPGFASYTIERIDYTTTFTLSGLCTGRAIESVSPARDDQPGNTLHVARDVTAAKGRKYEINFNVERPARATLRATCSGTPVDYPWSAVAQIFTAAAPFYADATATRLQGTYNLPGTPVTYTWDLRKGG